jgi:chemotaxis receptor (MCP) glutamine deamidase CheD
VALQADFIARKKSNALYGSKLPSTIFVCGLTDSPGASSCVVFKIFVSCVGVVSVRELVGSAGLSHVALTEIYRRRLTDQRADEKRFFVT